MDPLSILSLPMTMMNVVSGLSAGIPVIGDITPKTDGPLSDKEFGSYIASVICLIIMIYMLAKSPFKTPPCYSRAVAPCLRAAAPPAALSTNPSVVWRPLRPSESISNKVVHAIHVHVERPFPRDVD